MAIGDDGLLSDFGVDNFDVGGLISSTGRIAAIFAILLITAGIGFYLYKKKQKNINRANKKIVWWEDVNDKLTRVGQDEAEEVIIPQTSLRVFYIKQKDMWLPRFTQGVSLDLFFVALSKGRELVNFTLDSLESNLKRASIKIDHTDMRWAAENTREFIKRNYRDKSIPWWKEHKETIQLAIFIVLYTASMIAIIYFLGGLVDKIGLVEDQISAQLSDLAARSQTSGVVTGDIRT